jgi:hemin uptake protein HemP
VSGPPETDGSDGSPDGRSDAPPDVPRHEIRTLTRGGDRAVILHDGQAYTLRITRQNKLILTK